MGEDDVDLGDGETIAKDASDGGGGGVGELLDDGFVAELLTGSNERMKNGAFDLGEDDLFGELSGFADEDSGGLCHALDDERGGHDGKAGEVVVEVLFGKRDVLECDGPLSGFERFELVDPDPAHVCVCSEGAGESAVVVRPGMSRDGASRESGRGSDFGLHEIDDGADGEDLL